VTFLGAQGFVGVLGIGGHVLILFHSS